MRQACNHDRESAVCVHSSRQMCVSWVRACVRAECWLQSLREYRDGGREWALDSSCCIQLQLTCECC